MALIVGTDEDDNLFTQPFIIDTNIVRALGGNDLVRITNRDWYQAIGDRFDPDRYQVFRAANVDTVDLGAGDDLLIAGGGNDTLIGGTGYDIISYAEYYFAYLDFLEREVGEAYERGDQGVVVDLIAGTAMFSGATLESNLFPDERIFFNNVGIFSQTLTGFEAVIGTAYNDRISGTNRTDLTEVFDGYFGNDTINGRGGYDVASFHNTGGVVGDLNLMTVVGITEQQPAFNGGTFTVNDFTVRLLGIEGLYGSQDDDQLFGNSGDNLFHGRRGNNQINGRGGFDTVAYSFGTFGNKQVAGYSFNVENDMSSGVTINLETGVAVRLASSINHTDTLTSIEGVIGSIRDDHITGNTGGNTLDGVEGNDTIFGGLGSDELHGGADNDSLVGGAGNDVLTGGSSTAIVYDEDGILEEPAGVDTLDGGAGLDTVDYTMDGGRRGVTVSLLTGVATDSYALRDRIIGVENVTGTGLADRITGNTGVNILTGNAGNDVITGGGGRDSILGGAGDDTLRGGTARDAIEGGIGHDSLFGLDGNDSLEGEAGNDVIDAGTGDDTIEGGANDDSLLGGDGRDDIKGGDGKDTIAGGAGINVMDGEAGDDSVTGGVTVDILLGGGGNDTLRGGRTRRVAPIAFLAKRVTTRFMASPISTSCWAVRALTGCLAAQAMMCLQATAGRK